MFCLWWMIIITSQKWHSFWYTDSDTLNHINYGCLSTYNIWTIEKRMPMDDWKPCIWNDEFVFSIQSNFACQENALRLSNMRGMSGIKYSFGTVAVSRAMLHFRKLWIWRLAAHLSWANKTGYITHQNKGAHFDQAQSHCICYICGFSLLLQKLFIWFIVHWVEFNCAIEIGWYGLQFALWRLFANLSQILLNCVCLQTHNRIISVHFGSIVVASEMPVADLQQVESGKFERFNFLLYSFGAARRA